MSIYERPDWTALRSETAIDTQQPIVDAHHHLWDRDNSTYLAAELRADVEGSHNITRTVFVECSASYDVGASPELAPVGETRFVAEQAAVMARTSRARIGAIVSHADVTLGDAVEDVLAAHDAAGDGLFRGVRHGVNWSRHDSVKNGHHNPSQGQMTEAGFRRGVATLGRMGFSFDAWLYFDQLGELAELARAVPETTIIVNHLGGPLGIGPHVGAGRLEMLETWQAGIEAVASCPNVVLKVGGIGMEHYFGMPWSGLPRPPSSDVVAAWWSEVVGFGIDTFGPDRCMAESNYPVDRQTLPYPVLWNALQIMTAGYTADERNAIFHDTAARVYRIDTTPVATPGAN